MLILRVSLLFVIAISTQGCARYHTQVSRVSEDVSLLDYYRCTSWDCRYFDIGVAYQEVVVDGNRFVFDVTDGEILKLFSSGGRLLAVRPNNHSTFLCEVCSDGELSYLAEISNMCDGLIGDIYLEESEYQYSITIACLLSEGSSSPEQIRLEVFRGDGYEPCLPVLPGPRHNSIRGETEVGGEE